MGHIYKITNTINGKIYIGQTIKSVEKRFQQHKNNSNKPYFSQIVLYQAFNKYGIENFICEELEECPLEILDEREKYWIKFYNSYIDGYNSTLGGRAIELYDWDVEDIIEKYHLLKSARAVAKEIGCDHSTIDNILNINKVPRYTIAQQVSKSVIAFNDTEEYLFKTVPECAQWLIDTGKTKSTSLRNVRQYITRFISNKKSYLGYFYKYQEE